MSSIKKLEKIEQIPEFAELKSSNKCQVRHIVNAFDRVGISDFNASEKKLAVPVNFFPSTETMRFISDHFMDRSNWKRVTHGKSGNQDFLYFHTK